MELNNLKPAKGSTHHQKRIGRGAGSGHGGTATRGHKGAQSRSGYSRKLGFEGGQMPLQRRLPKFGFTNINRVEYKAINLSTLEELAAKRSIDVITTEVLISAGFAQSKDKVKILGNGTLSKALKVTSHAFSKSAVAAIEAAGGSVETLCSGKKSKECAGE
ncbi:MAG: 50S ribosomal protein L15 [Rikenellaceae bacterium]